MTTDHNPPADQAAEIERLRTQNARMRHELEVMYGGAFDNPPADLPPAARVAGFTSIREALLEAIDAPYIRSLGYGSREELLAAYDTSRAPAADRAAALREAADEAGRVAESLRAHHEFERSKGALDVRAELLRMADETQPGIDTASDRAQQPAHPAAPDLSNTERTMLRYALDQAQEHIWSRGGFTDEDQAAVDSLRRLTAAERQDETQAEPDTCRTVNVDGQTISVRGGRPFTQLDHQFFGEVIRAARRRYAAEHPDEPAVTVHAIPLPGSNGISSCCGRPPFEFVGERVTRDPDKVTCTGLPAERQDGALS